MKGPFLLAVLSAVAGALLKVHAAEAKEAPSPAVFAPPIPERLTLRQAEEYALANQPALAASRLNAEAEKERVYEARSQFFPQIQLESVAVKARNDDSRLAAATGITNPTIISRQSDGGLLSQLITDFGRTYYLTTSARSEALSAAQHSEATRQGLLFRVDQAYFGVQGARALLSVANQNLATNNLLLDRMNALARTKLKSGLDVSFQQVAVAQARLLELQAETRMEEGYAELSASMGLPQKAEFILEPEILGPAPAENVAPLIFDALAHRPDLLAARADRDAALRFAKAERAAHFPVVSAQGGMGISPERDDTLLPSNYGAIGINISVPIFTGGLLTARSREAFLRAQAAEKTLEDEETEASRDVFDAWFEARTAYDAISVTDQLLKSAEEAFQLAQARYEAGTSSIVELSQAELQEIQAQITGATSRFDFQVRRRALDLQMGAVK